MKLKPNIVLQVNQANAGQIQVNVTTQVNSQQIRRETYNGREHWVIPSRTLPFGCVMNGGLYEREQIEANYQTLEGTLAPLGHPTVNGQFVSAFSPEGINVGHVGAWNRNVSIEGNRVYVEKWLDIEVAQRTEDGQRLLDRLDALEKGEGEPIHTSVAAFVERLEPNNIQKEQGAQWVAKIASLDHDAILLDEPGAATPADGVGLMVNADQAQPLQANTGALVGESFREREQRLDRAAKQRFAPGTEDYAWVADFTETQAVIVRNGGAAEVYSYKTEGGKVVFDDTGTPVQRQESWVTVVANSIKKIFNPQARPAVNKEGEMPLTPEEKAELTQDISKAVAANMAEALKPITDKVDKLQANHQALADTLTANQKAEEDEKRKAVAAKYGEVVANALFSDALDAMFKSLGEPAPLAGNSANDSNANSLAVTDYAAHFGGAK